MSAKSQLGALAFTLSLPSQAYLLQTAKNNKQYMMDQWLNQVDQLFAQVKLGDHHAFTELYNHTSNKLYGLLWAMEPNLASDVLQESFIKFWQRADMHSVKLGHPWHWMVQIARNTMIDKLRHEQRQVKPTSFIESFEPNCPTTAQCIAKLPADHRQAVIYSYIHGYSHQEMSKHWGKPLGSIKTMLRRALLELKQCLVA